MRLVKSNLLLFAVALTTALSCAKSGNEPAPNPSVNFIAKTDGAAFESGGHYVTAELSMEKTGPYTLIIGAFDYNDVNTGKGRAVTISFSGSDFDNLEVGDEFVDYDKLTGEGAIGIYLDCQSFSECVGGTSLSENGSAYLKITALDKEKRIVSGEFAFDADDENENHYGITDGLFRKVEYLVED